MNRHMRRRSAFRVLFTIFTIVLTGVAAIVAPNAPRVAAQEDIAASVVEGTCDRPGDVVADLHPLKVAEGGALTSFTSIDIAIDELTGGGYAIVAGEPAAPSACGEIAGEGTDIYLELPAQNDANLSGLAWLHARDDRTQISLFAGEGIGMGSTGAEDDPSGVPEPPVEETPEPVEQPEDFVTYTSPNYGYTVTYDADIWRVSIDRTEPTQQGPVDLYVLKAGIVQAEFHGFAGDSSLTAERTIENFLQSLIADTEHYENVRIRTDADGTPIRGGDKTKAWAAIDFTRLPDSGPSRYERTYHLVSWQLPGNNYLIMLFDLPSSVYDDWIPAREALEGGVAVPSK